MYGQIHCITVFQTHSDLGRSHLRTVERSDDFPDSSVRTLPSFSSVIAPGPSFPVHVACTSVPFLPGVQAFSAIHLPVDPFFEFFEELQWPPMTTVSTLRTVEYFCTILLWFARKISKFGCQKLKIRPNRWPPDPNKTEGVSMVTKKIRHLACSSAKHIKSFLYILSFGLYDESSDTTSIEFEPNSVELR